MSYNNAALTAEPLETGKVTDIIDLQLTHWQCHRDIDKVEWWLLDQQGNSTNTLSQDVLTELKKLLVAVEQSDVTKAVVIRSSKSNGFIAGAEISEFQKITDSGEVEVLLKEGHDLLNRLENLSIPTIALLHGFCLGGGLELALACRYRIARNDTMLGFPEVNLGLHPGLGGTMRLPRQIIPSEALKMMLSGKPVTAKKAKSLGLVDACGEERHFAKAVRMAATGELDHRGQSTSSQWLNKSPINLAIAHFSEKQLREKVREDHYPAPYDLIELWREHSGNEQAMLDAERRSFANLLSEKKTQNLIRVFFLREKLKSQGKGDHHIHHVHVVGAGSMGGDIAAWCALQGFSVTLEDKKPELIAPAIKRAHGLFSHKLDSETEQRDAHDRLMPDASGYGRRMADLLIEAVPENLELKTTLLTELETVKKPGAILATNTSSILLENIRGKLRDPSHFVGIHFFNPVAKMHLVEVVTHDQLDKDILARAQSFTVAINRLPATVKSSPGFLINRILTPYLLEALALLDEGVPKEDIDKAAEDFGMPMGPIELSDVIGLDICLEVAKVLHRDLDQPLYAIPDWFRAKVEKGELGKKSGVGFYNYKTDGESNKKQPDKNRERESIDEVIQDRLIYPILNTCMYCLQEGVITDTDMLDGAVIFATGFAPFTGGPLAFAKAKGIQAVVDRLHELTEKYGERFAPAAHWQKVLTEDVSTKEQYAGREPSAA